MPFEARDVVHSLQPAIRIRVPDQGGGERASRSDSMPGDGGDSDPGSGDDRGEGERDLKVRLIVNESTLECPMCGALPGNAHRDRDCFGMIQWAANVSEPETKETEIVKARKSAERYVVVTTDLSRRGVFGGILESNKGGTAVLRDARICVYWSKETRGVVGLAAIGPQKGSRISPPAPRMELDGVTAIMDCTDEARKLWEAAPWQS